MAKTKVDGVIEAVHYGADGRLVWARVYERRGPTFSDLVVLDRAELMKRVKAGKKYIGGKRQSLLASTFDLYKPVAIVTHGGSEYLSAGDPRQNQDYLAEIPLV